MCSHHEPGCPFCFQKRKELEELQKKVRDLTDINEALTKIVEPLNEEMNRVVKSSNEKSKRIDQLEKDNGEMKKSLANLGCYIE
jgi:septal ring factor EnvC (AmiA/AmiB activator)